MVIFQLKNIVLIILVIFLGGCITEALIIAPIPLDKDSSGKGFRKEKYPPYEPIAPQEQEQALKDIPLLVEEIKRKQSQKDKRVEKKNTVLNGTMQYEEQFATVSGEEINKRIKELGYNHDKADIVDAATDWLIKNKKDTIPYLIQALEKYNLSKYDRVVRGFCLSSLGILALDPVFTLTPLIGKPVYPSDLIYVRVYKIIRYDLKEESIPHLEKVNDDPKTSKKLKEDVESLLITSKW